MISTFLTGLREVCAPPPWLELINNPCEHTLRHRALLLYSTTTTTAATTGSRHSASSSRVQGAEMQGASAQGFQHLHFPLLRQDAQSASKANRSIHEKINEATVTYTHLCCRGCALWVCPPNVFLPLQMWSVCKRIPIVSPPPPFSCFTTTDNPPGQNVEWSRSAEKLLLVFSPYIVSARRRGTKMPAEQIRLFNVALIRRSSSEGSGCASPSSASGERGFFMSYLLDQLESSPVAAERR